MRNLYLSKEVSRRVAPALQQELSEENVTEVLRALQNAYRAIGHRDLFKKPSDSSLMPDSRLVTGTPLVFSVGNEERGIRTHSGSMIHNYSALEITITALLPLPPRSCDFVCDICGIRCPRDNYTIMPMELKVIWL